MAKKKKPIIIAGVILVLCLIVAGIFVLTANSAERRLADQLELGQKYLEELEYEQAIVAYEAAIAIDPKCVDAYLGMAEAYAGMGEYEKSLENLDRALELDGENELARDLLDDCLEKYIDVLAAEKRYDDIRALAEKYGNLAVGLDFQGTPEEEKGGEAEAAERTDTEQIQVSVRKTDIQADGVFNQEGYGCLTINGVGSLWENWEHPESVIPPQTAMVDAGGNFVFPYVSTYLTYHISEGVVSLTEDSPYRMSDGYALDQYLPAYYNLDGSSVFVPEFTTEKIDEHTTETVLWHGGPMQDGYALVIRHVNTSYWDGFLGAAGYEEYSCIMDQNGTITCTLPEDFNETISEGEDGFTTKYSLGWCGEGLFAVFENSYDDNWYYSGEGKGYMDPAGNMVIDLSGRGYTYLWRFCGGLAAVQSESGTIGFIDKTGALVIPCSYENVTSFSADGVCGVQKDGKWGYISTDGSELIPFEYDSAYGAGDGLAAVVKDGKCGLVDYSNRVVVPLEYDDISSGEGGTAYAIKDGVLYIISR